MLDFIVQNERFSATDKREHMYSVTRASQMQTMGQAALAGMNLLGTWRKQAEGLIITGDHLLYCGYPAQKDGSVGRKIRLDINSPTVYLSIMIEYHCYAI